MSWDLIINGVVGLVGAGIGGWASMSATKKQISHQEEEQQSEKKENMLRTANMIETFLTNEIGDNLHNIKFLESYFDKGYLESKRETVLLKRELNFEEYEKIKIRLLETNTILSKKTIEIYHMFYMLSNLGKSKEKLSDFNENEFNYIVNRYNLAKDMVNDYFEKKYENF